MITLHFSEPTLETQQAAGLISDADRCKLLLSSLHETSARREDTCPVKAKLAQVSADLNTFLLGESLCLMPVVCSAVAFLNVLYTQRNET